MVYKTSIDMVWFCWNTRVFSSRTFLSGSPYPQVSEHSPDVFLTPGEPKTLGILDEVKIYGFKIICCSLHRDNLVFYTETKGMVYWETGIEYVYIFFVPSRMWTWHIVLPLSVCMYVHLSITLWLSSWFRSISCKYTW